jgi:hypothetical protein
MTTEHDPRTRIVVSWLREDAHESAERVLLAALNEIDHTQQRRSWWPAWRFSDMNSVAKILVATAAVVAVAVAGINLLPGIGTGTGGVPPSPSPTATAEPTPTPEPSVAEPSRTPEGNLTLGETFNLSLPQYPIAIIVTIPADGWSGDPGVGFIVKGDADPPGGAGIITFADEGYFVYGDPCQWSTTRPDTPATTVDELVTALSAQASRDASAPVDITVDGYAGKSITLHVPDDADFAECDGDKFSSWGVPGENPARWHQGPGQIDNVWILDVDGHVVVIDWAHYEGTPQDVVDELVAIVESTTFEQP